MKIISLILTVCIVSAVAIRRDEISAQRNNEDLEAEPSRRRIYDIIQDHEGRKYGDHGGHEYEEGEIPGTLSGRKSRRIGYLPVAEEGKSSLYYAVAPKRNHRLKDNVYRENVAAYAAKEINPVHVGNAPQQVVASPLSHSHYAVVDPKTHNQYIVYENPKYHKPTPVVADPKHSYILEEDPHYAAPHQVIVAEAPVASHVVHYPAPVKNYAPVPVKEYAPVPVKEYAPVHVKEYTPVHVKEYIPAHVKDYDSHYDSHHKSDDKSHHSSSHGYYGDNDLHKESGHKESGKHEISGHKSHSSSAGHHDEHDHHHNRAHYERDRGYHYEKAYAYDRVRASHDIGSTKAAHSGYKAHHGHEGYKDAGDHGAQSYMYFKKHGHHGDHGYHDNKNSLHKTGRHGGGQGYHDYGRKYLPRHHAYGK